MPAAVKPAPHYQRRHPERTLWYRTVQNHFATWLALAAGPDDAAPLAYVEQASRRHLEYSVLQPVMADSGPNRCPVEYAGNGR